jgi:hypothetical protein
MTTQGGSVVPKHLQSELLRIWLQTTVFISVQPIPRRPLPQELRREPTLPFVSLLEIVWLTSLLAQVQVMMNPCRYVV